MDLETQSFTAEKAEEINNLTNKKLPLKAIDKKETRSQRTKARDKAELVVILVHGL